MKPPKRMMANVPDSLAAAVEARMKEERYLSASAYLVSLIAFDLYARKPHQLTGQLHKERQEMQDVFFAELSAYYFAGGKGTPGWFERRLKELLDEERAKLPGVE
jgi:hypothetical protein